MYELNIIVSFERLLINVSMEIVRVSDLKTLSDVLIRAEIKEIEYHRNLLFSDHITSNFLKAVFHKFHLVHS